MLKLVVAMKFAVKKHRFQKRKNDGSSYIIHPFSVEDRLEKVGVTDVDILCAAILHDTVEDTETSLDEICKVFGQNVRNLVEDVTDDKSFPKDEIKKKQILKAETISEGALLIKLADKIDNLWDILDSPPADWQEERIQGYIIWCRAVTEKIKSRYLSDFKNNKCFSKLLDQLETFYEKSQVKRSEVTLEDYLELMKNLGNKKPSVIRTIPQTLTESF